MEDYDKIYFAANLLIDISENMQKKHGNIKQEISPMAWAKEFCTVKFYTSRRSGHTSCIKRLAEERFENKIILFLDNQNMINFYKRSFIAEKPPSYPIFSRHAIDNSLRGKDFSEKKAVLVDTSYTWSREKMGQLYGLLIETRLCEDHDDPFIFILVQ